jgi:bacterioferritin-associated ferredoxin
LREAAERLQERRPDLPVTTGRVFQEIGVKPQCGSCVHSVRRVLLEWGFPATCPEPLASISGAAGSAEREEAKSRLGTV